MAYQLTSNPNIIQRLNDGAFIPNDPANADWRTYQAWVAAGNVAEPVPAPTQAQLNAEAASAVQGWLDSTAQAAPYLYANIVAAVSYAGSSVDLWNRQGTAFKAWRDSVWQALFTLQTNVASGKATAPATPAALIASLPQPNIPTV